MKMKWRTKHNEILVTIFMIFTFNDFIHDRYIYMQFQTGFVKMRPA